MQDLQLDPLCKYHQETKILFNILNNKANIFKKVKKNQQNKNLLFKYFDFKLIKNKYLF